MTALSSADSAYSDARSPVGRAQAAPVTMNERPGSSSTVDSVSARRPLGGLGRGLDRILDQSPGSETVTAETSGAGLGLLVGQQQSSKAATVRAFVVETALAAVADAFGADGVVMTTRERSDQAADSDKIAISPSLSLRLPPSWGPSSPPLFAVYGNLWGMLNSESHHCLRCGTSEQPLAYRQEKVDSYWAWFCRIDDQALSVASALVRATPFDRHESDALARSMRSVAAAVSANSGQREGVRSSDLPVATNVSVAANPDSSDPTVAIAAEVTVYGGPQRLGNEPGGVSSLSEARRIRDPLASLTATGRGPDIETAVARAAANACHPQCEIGFAGSSDLDGNTISVVIVSDSTGAPRLGVSVRPVGDYSGVAEAVFLAASPGGIPSPG